MSSSQPESPSTFDRFVAAFAAVARTYREARFQPRDAESDREWLGRLYDAERYGVTVELLAAACRSGGVVADVGAWPGYFAVALQKLGWSVTAVDKDATRPTDRDHVLDDRDPRERSSGTSMADMCRQEGVRVVSADIELDRIPFEDGEVDAVVMAEVIEHTWRDPLHVFAEVNRILRRSGVLVLTTPNLLALRHRLAFLRGEVHRVIEHPFISFRKASRMGHLGHLRLYAPRELSDLLTLHGFSCTFSFADITIGEQMSAPASEDRPVAVRASSTLGRIRRRFLKSPREFARAGEATLVAALERRRPHLRGRMFVVATKVADAGYEQRFGAEIARLARENRVDWPVEVAAAFMGGRTAGPAPDPLSPAPGGADAGGFRR